MWKSGAEDSSAHLSGPLSARFLWYRTYRASPHRAHFILCTLTPLIFASLLVMNSSLEQIAPTPTAVRVTGGVLSLIGGLCSHLSLTGGDGQPFISRVTDHGSRAVEGVSSRTPGPHRDPSRLPIMVREPMQLFKPEQYVFVVKHVC